MSTIDRRLSALEQRQKESQKPGILGIRIFEQSPNNPALFHPVAGPFDEDWQVCTDTEIDALCAQGWKCITVMRPATPVNFAR